MPDLVYVEHDPATWIWSLHAYSEGEGSREIAPGPSALPRPYNDLLRVRPTTGELLYSSTDSSGNDQHYVLLNPATGEFRRLALPGEVQDWSPSGDLLTTYSGGDHLIVNLEGAIRMTICGSSDDCGVPEWEAGSDAVIVFRRPDGGHADLWRVPLTGEAEVNLTQSPATDEIGPSYSPTGQHFAYLREHVELVLVNADGTGARQLMSPVGIGKFPWSPDGLSVAVDATLEGHTGLVVVPLQGAPHRVTSPGETLYIPSHIGWFPDGSRLLYSAFDGAANDNVGLYVINLDGSGRRKVNRSGTDAYAAAWIPDVP
jgi:Tol biopolymer transport system component